MTRGKFSVMYISVAPIPSVQQLSQVILTTLLLRNTVLLTIWIFLGLVIMLFKLLEGF